MVGTSILLLCMASLDDSYKNNIGAKLTNRLGLALEQHEIEEEDAVQIIDMILPAFEIMTQKEELIDFLSKLSSTWPFFAELVDEETTKLQAGDTIEQLFAERNVQMVGVGRSQ